MARFKECFKCKTVQPLTEFYKHQAMADGHLNKCKTCTKNDVATHRLQNLEKIRAYDRRRAKLPKRAKAAQPEAALPVRRPGSGGQAARGVDCSHRRQAEPSHHHAAIVHAALVSRLMGLGAAFNESYLSCRHSYVHNDKAVAPAPTFALYYRLIW